MEPPGQVTNLDDIQLVLAGAAVLRYDARSNCATLMFAFARPEPPSSGGESTPTLSSALLERAVASVHARAAQQGHIGGCSAMLTTLAPLPNIDSPLPSFLGLESAASLGFLAVSGVSLFGAGQLAVLRSDDIPCSETGSLHLPAKLVAEYARSCGESAERVAEWSARKFFPLSEIVCVK